MIQLSNINKSFKTRNGEIQIFNDFNLAVQEGDFVAILGPNGCGKSTLFNLITGIDADYKGLIDIKSKDKSINHSIAYMLQKDLLLPWLTVIQNIMLGIEIQKKDKQAALKLANEYLEMLKITKLKNEYPANLSGGERQKVSLIRTLILNTDILLLDEPFSAIDYNTRLELQTMILEYAEKKNTTILLISHDIDEAIAVSNRIVIIGKNAQGIVWDMKIELNIPNRNPMTVRQNPNFANYYKQIWESYPKQK